MFGWNRAPSRTQTVRISCKFILGGNWQICLFQRVRRSVAAAAVCVKIAVDAQCASTQRRTIVSFCRDDVVPVFRCPFRSDLNGRAVYNDNDNEGQTVTEGHQTAHFLTRFVMMWR